MRILHVLESVNEHMAGQAAYVSQLASATAHNERMKTEVFSFDLPEMGNPLGFPPDVNLHLVSPGRPYIYGRSAKYKRLLDLASQYADSIFHIHGIWRWPMLAAARFARARKRPYIVSPHGSLEPWSLSQKSLRKRLVTRMMGRLRWVERANVLHATSGQEAENLADQFPGTPIAVIPIGVSAETPARHSDRKTRRTAMLLSRLVPNKGVIELLRAWAAIKPAGWGLKIAGPDEGGYLAQCRQATRELGLERDVEFTGPVYGQAKWQMYQDADLFVLPTMSENFGLVIAEALSCGTPVITTKTAPWEDLIEYECGWWIEPTADELTETLRKAFSLPPEALEAMGDKGRNFAQEKFSWMRIAQKMISVYDWLAGRSEKPDCVIYP